MTIENPPSSLITELEAMECEHPSFELIPLHSGVYRACCPDCGESKTVFNEP